MFFNLFYFLEHELYYTHECKMPLKVSEIPLLDRFFFFIRILYDFIIS